MRKRPTARQLEAAMASRRAPRAQRTAPRHPVHAWLLRRGLEFKPTEPDLPFPPDLPAQAQDRFGELLHGYAFRLFLRGAILCPDGFAPSDATRYVSPAKAAELSRALVGLGLAQALPRGRFRLVKPARTFGGTLEWYVGRELERRVGFDVATGLAWKAPGIGGDLDLVALADARLVYVELKSSPPKHLSTVEVARFADRVRALRPEVAVLAFDTSLRLADKVVPMVAAELERRAPVAAPRRVVRELFAMTPHLYLVNAKWDLVANVQRAIAEGLRALAPEPP